MWSLPIWASVAVLAVVVAFVAVSTFGGKSTGGGGQPTTAPVPTTTQPVPTPTPAPAQPPIDYLKAQAAADRDDVENRLVGAWVPQISSKKNGLFADGQVYTDQDVLDDHRRLRSEYPYVRLVWSGDYTSFKGTDFWVTLVGMTYSTADDANAWCVSQNLDADHCYAKRLSHTEGPQNNTRTR